MLKLIRVLRAGVSWYERFEKGLAYVAGFLIIVMAFTCFYEAVARYVFNAPTKWSFELNMNLLLYLAFLAGGYTLAINKHVRVDILYDKWSPRRKAAVDIITFLVAFLFISILIWKSLDMSLYSLKIGERSNQSMHWPLFPLEIMISIGGMLVGLQMIIKMVRDIHLVFFSSSRSVDPS